MSLVPNNLHDFYVNIEKDVLYQGDILDAKTIDLKIDNSASSPDHWLIITKSCDLVIDKIKGNLRKNHVSIIPLLKISTLIDILFPRNPSLNLFRKIVILPIFKIIHLPKFGYKLVTEILSDRYTKWQFIPPDGQVFNEPRVVDFDLVKFLDGAEMEILQKILLAKKLQLASPFREKIAQRFANHYSSIGINDNDIKSDVYKEKLKKYSSTETL